MNNSIYQIQDIYLEKIWGSKKIDDKTIGEIIKFEINKERSNNVVDSLGNSYNLYDLYTSPKKELLFGNKYINIDKFPFLIKTIHSSKNLSVQVHPKEKKETWLFLKDNSKILLGLKDDISKESMSVDSLLDKANIMEMSKYNFAIVEPGTIHSILKDNDVCEVQNNYDVTYRYYDWDNNRKLTQEEFINNACLSRFNNSKNVINELNEYNSEKFNMKMYHIKEQISFSQSDTCQVIIIIDGNGVLKTNSEEFRINKDESYFIIPNTNYEIIGNVDILLVS